MLASLTSAKSGSAAIFYLIAFSLATVMALLATRPGGKILIILYMFSPLLAVLAVHLFVTREALSRAGWRKIAIELAIVRPGFRGWPFALLVPPLLLGAVTLAVFATGIGIFHTPADAGSVMLWVFGLAFNLAIGLIYAFGEEAGWRGYLLPSLIGLGIWPAMLLTGFLHGLWHLPVMLLTPFYHVDGSRWIVLPEFLVILTLAGIVYGYLRQLTGSIWPAVILHATFNEAINQFQGITTAPDPAMLEYMGAESGVFTILGAAVLVYWIARHWPKPAPGAWPAN